VGLSGLCACKRGQGSDDRDEKYLSLHTPQIPSATETRVQPRDTFTSATLNGTVA
jgi:hypothetical protein